MKCNKMTSLTFISTMIMSGSMLASYGNYNLSELEELVKQYSNGTHTAQEIMGILGLNLGDINKYINVDGTLNMNALNSLNDVQKTVISELLKTNGFTINRDEKNNITSITNAGKNLNAQDFTNILLRAITQNQIPISPTTTTSSARNTVIPSMVSSPSASGISTTTTSSSSEAVSNWTTPAAKSVNITSQVQSNPNMHVSVSGLLQQVLDKPNQVVELKVGDLEWRFSSDDLIANKDIVKTFSPIVKIENEIVNGVNATIIDFDNNPIPGSASVKVSAGAPNEEMIVFYVDSLGHHKLLKDVKLDAQGKVIIIMNGRPVDFILVKKSDAAKINALTTTAPTLPTNYGT